MVRQSIHSEVDFLKALINIIIMLMEVLVLINPKQPQGLSFFSI